MKKVHASPLVGVCVKTAVGTKLQTPTLSGAAKGEVLPVRSIDVAVTFGPLAAPSALVVAAVQPG